MALTKDELEKHKLELEILELKRKPWAKASFWNSFGALIISVITVGILYVNGAFDFKRQELAAKTENLSFDLKNLDVERSAVQKRVNTFKDDSIRLYLSNKRLNDSINNLKDQITFVNRALDAMKKGNKNYERSVFQKLQAENQAKIQFMQGDIDVANMNVSTLTQRLKNSPIDSCRQLQWENAQLQEENRRLKVLVPSRRIEPVPH